MRLAARSALASTLALASLVACGETRGPIGDECLRDDDCLSGVCSSRLCVAAPALVSGASAPPPDELPRIPIVDGGADASSDAPSEGG
jgi:hypothetical protein